MCELIRERRRAKVDAGSIGEPQSLDLWKQPGRTDTANGRRLAQGWGDLFRWCEPWNKWLFWDGKRWNADNELKVVACAKRISESIWREASRILPDVSVDLAIDIVRYAKATASSRGIENMMKLARSEPGIPVLSEQLDSHPWYFNCANGVIDLKSGRLLVHRKEFLLTKLSPVEYPLDPGIDCSLWLKTLDKIFSGNSDLIGFFRRLMGSAMVGSVLENILAIFFGCGSNGKSLLVETMLEIFGEYGSKAAPELLMAKRREAHPTERADLYGRRLVFAVESDDGRRLSESTVKELTGGDTIKARPMREDFWEFKPSHTLILATNHKPRVYGSDHAIWRRVRLVPFNVTFWDESRGECGPPELKADKRLKERLRDEFPAILRWLVAACMEWQQIGLGEPEAIMIATAEYRDAEDVLREFFDTCIVPCPEGQVRASQLRTIYQDWCKANNEKPVSNKRLGEHMNDKEIERKSSNGIVYHGITLVEGWKD